MLVAFKLHSSNSSWNVNDGRNGVLKYPESKFNPTCHHGYLAEKPLCLSGSTSFPCSSALSDRRLSLIPVRSQTFLSSASISARYSACWHSSSFCLLAYFSINSYMHTHIHIHPHTYTHTYICICLHKHTHIHIYMYSTYTNECKVMQSVLQCRVAYLLLM